MTLADISSAKKKTPSRHFLYAVEGWGKTSLGAQTKAPVFLQSRGETGLDTLVASGLIPETPAFPECQNWQDVLDAVDALLGDEHGYKTLVIDTVNGLERLCHEFVCQRDFGGDWGEHGFLSYGKGPKVSIADWMLLLQRLDRLRTEKGMTIFLLGHAKVSTFKNPQGADFDRYQAEMDKETYSVTAKWADSILFGNFETTVKNGKSADVTKKGKAVDVYRALFTERAPAFDAKNRLGLPAEIDMGASAAEGWANLVTAIREAVKEKEQVNG